MSAAAQDDTAVAARTELRNYHVRTYSGDSLLHQARAGLLRSTTISSLVKPNPGLKFTKVELGIAPDIDMKLMDIIMGNDMLHEGVIKNEDKQNLSKDIKSALGGTGKRIGLKNRYEAHREAFFSAVKQISQNRNEMIRTILVKFQEKWSTISQDMSRLLQVVTTDKVGELTYDEYLDALKSIGQGNQKRKLLIDQQRTKIEDIETGRTEQINSSVNKAGIALNSLNLYPPVTVQRFLDVNNYHTG